MYQKGEITKSISLTDSVKLIEIHPSTPFIWDSGQFIVTKNRIEGEERVADYTITSSVEHPEIFQIMVENYPGSHVGEFLHSLKNGETFKFNGPKGRYLLQKTQTKKVFISLNIGSVANIAHLQFMADHKDLYTQENLIIDVLTPEFTSLYPPFVEKFSNLLQIQYVPIQITDQNPGWAQGKPKKKELDQIFAEHLTNEFYIAGKSEFVKSLRSKLIGIGVDKTQITREFFG